MTIPYSPTKKAPRHVQWVVPAAEGAEYVPDASTVGKIVSELAASGWIREGPSSQYEPDPPFYYSTFLGVADESEVRRGDARFDVSLSPNGVIRQSHCQTITLMVTDTLLVAPTANAQATRLRCSTCREPLLAHVEAEKSRVVPSLCQECGAVVKAADLAGFPLFRFAVVIELWFPPMATTVLSIDPDLLAMLKRQTGFSFWDEAQ